MKWLTDGLCRVARAAPALIAGACISYAAWLLAPAFGFFVAGLLIFGARLLLELADDET